MTAAIMATRIAYSTAEAPSWPRRTRRRRLRARLDTPGPERFAGSIVPAISVPGTELLKPSGKNDSSAAGRAGLAPLRNADERDVAGLDHAQAFPRQPLEIGRVLELLRPLLQGGVLDLEGMHLALQLRDVRPLRQIRADRIDEREADQHHDHAEDHRPSGELHPAGDVLHLLLRAHRSLAVHEGLR